MFPIGLSKEELRENRRITDRKMLSTKSGVFISALIVIIACGSVLLVLNPLESNNVVKWTDMPIHAYSMQNHATWPANEIRAQTVQKEDWRLGLVLVFVPFGIIFLGIPYLYWIIYARKDTPTDRRYRFTMWIFGALTLMLFLVDFVLVASWTVKEAIGIGVSFPIPPP